MPKLDHFGFLAPYYDSLSEPKMPEKLCSLIGCPPDGRILDAGGGTGRVAQFLTSPTNQVVVADQSIKMLQQTKSKNRLRSVCSLTESLPFEDATFDRIIMVDAFHHVENQPQTCQELWRLLKPGGRIVIQEPDIARFAVKLVAVAEKLAFMRSHILPSSKIASLFTEVSARHFIEKEGHNAWIVITKEKL